MAYYDRINSEAVFESQVEADELKTLSDRLATELRGQIRKLQSYDILSPKWCDLADAIGRISQISQMVRVKVLLAVLHSILISEMPSTMDSYNSCRKHSYQRRPKQLLYGSARN